MTDHAAPPRSAAASELFPAVYGELRALAARLMVHQPPQTLEPTALVHEVYARLARAPDPGRTQDHLLALAATAMRQLLIDHARRRRADRRGGDREREHLTVDCAATEPGHPAIDALALHDALEELERLHPRQCRVVELRFFAGLTIPRVAAIIGVSHATVEADWAMARAWLLHRLGELAGRAREAE